MSQGGFTGSGEISHHISWEGKWYERIVWYNTRFLVAQIWGKGILGNNKILSYTILCIDALINLNSSLLHHVYRKVNSFYRIFFFCECLGVQWVGWLPSKKLRNSGYMFTYEDFVAWGCWDWPYWPLSDLLPRNTQERKETKPEKGI